MSLRRMQAACTPAGSRATQPARRRVVMAAASTDVPPNVAEARAWIAAWRAKQQKPAAASGNGNGTSAAPAAAKSAPAPKAAAGAGKFGASASFSDGTLVFTADQLQAVNYSDVNLKSSKKR